VRGVIPTAAASPASTRVSRYVALVATFVSFLSLRTRSRFAAHLHHYPRCDESRYHYREYIDSYISHAVLALELRRVAEARIRQARLPVQRDGSPRRRTSRATCGAPQHSAGQRDLSASLGAARLHRATHSRQHRRELSARRRPLLACLAARRSEPVALTGGYYFWNACLRHGPTGGSGVSKLPNAAMHRARGQRHVYKLVSTPTPTCAQGCSPTHQRAVGARCPRLDGCASRPDPRHALPTGTAPCACWRARRLGRQAHASRRSVCSARAGFTQRILEAGPARGIEGARAPRPRTASRASGSRCWARIRLACRCSQAASRTRPFARRSRASHGASRCA